MSFASTTAEVEFPKYAYKLEYFDEPSLLLREYIIQYYTQKGEIEIYDCRQKRVILRKTLEHKIKLSDLYIGNKILVNARQYQIVGYGDEYTRSGYMRDAFQGTDNKGCRNISLWSWKKGREWNNRKEYGWNRSCILECNVECLCTDPAGKETL